VLVDMWATWCKNCLTMDRATLADPAVTAALGGDITIKFQAENPDDPATQP
jgi:thiol:disulfide interchange protein